jgi:hypothetical protein
MGVDEGGAGREEPAEWNRVLECVECELAEAGGGERGKRGW